MSKKEFDNIIAFHPGYYLESLREEMEITQLELSKRLDTTAKTISKLINGKISLSEEMAINLSKMFGTSVELWLNLQKTYDKKKLEIDKAIQLDKEISIAKEINYKYFVDLKSLEPTRSWKEKVTNLCEFLKISSLDVLKKKDFLVNFRNSNSKINEKNVINSNIWLQTALNFGKEIETKKYNESKLLDNLTEIREMTLEEPKIFYPKLKSILKECGVAFVVLPHLKNSGINGAVKWINKDKVLLAMNDRNKFADIFWFSFFHEIKHVLQHKIKYTIISEISNKNTLESIDESLENEADQFAIEVLIPNDKYNDFIKKKNFSRANILSFSKKMNIHPCILIGRLQHDKLVSYKNFVDLKIKYTVSN